MPAPALTRWGFDFAVTEIGLIAVGVIALMTASVLLLREEYASRKKSCVESLRLSIFSFKEKKMRTDDSIKNYKRAARKCISFAIVLSVCLLLLAVASVGLGAMKLSFGDVLCVIWGKLTGNAALYSDIKAGEAAVVWDIRLPRILCGALVGAGLSASGVIFQSILQNPLADPYTLGISTGAAFGASLAIMLNLLLGVFLPIPLFALAFALLTLAAVIAISIRGGGLVSSNLIIAGIIVSSILSAGISFMKMLAGENVSAIVFWIMGSLGSKHWSDVALLAPVVLVGIALSQCFASDLNLMALGGDTAQTLGVNVKRVRLMYLVIGSAITAVCVSACGVIGFIGLVVPHLLRFSHTPDNRLLLPLSSLLGALLLMAADNVTRLISNGEIPVGVLTTLFGGPFFIWIFIRRRRLESNG